MTTLNKPVFALLIVIGACSVVHQQQKMLQKVDVRTYGWAAEYREQIDPRRILRNARRKVEISDAPSLQLIEERLRAFETYEPVPSEIDTRIACLLYWSSGDVDTLGFGNIVLGNIVMQLNDDARRGDTTLLKLVSSGLDSAYREQVATSIRLYWGK